jgi:hypothetical protein
MYKNILNKTSPMYGLNGIMWAPKNQALAAIKPTLNNFWLNLNPYTALHQ